MLIAPNGTCRRAERESAQEKEGNELKNAREHEIDSKRRDTEILLKIERGGSEIDDGNWHIE